jgi:hypothetical protein
VQGAAIVTAVAITAPRYATPPIPTIARPQTELAQSLGSNATVARLCDFAKGHDPDCSEFAVKRSLGIRISRVQFGLQEDTQVPAQCGAGHARHEVVVSEGITDPLRSVDNRLSDGTKG